MQTDLPCYIIRLYKIQQYRRIGETALLPLFKKGSTSNPENYRGITLLKSSMKLFIRILGRDFIGEIELSEEQQDFRKNRSTIDAIFIVRQITEKALEFNKPAYLCFIDLTKAFDRLRNVKKN